MDWASRGRRQRGFSLVEVMIAASIVAVLSALATYGVRRYLVFAKSAEAKQTIGGIARAVVMSVDRLQERNQGGQALCASSTTVPDAFWPVRGTRYVPKRNEGADYNTGSTTEGWRCLGFQVTQPQYYQYRYRVNGSPIPVSGRFPSDVPLEHRWAAYARGDLDGDGRDAWFALEGYVKNGQTVFASKIGAQDPDE
ncbi:type II secretion system protein [Sorangium cellulosum]|nr:prepilin-type N-terminal cleavage/methylation domain-containing protein [Sorangium cellulosum]